MTATSIRVLVVDRHQTFGELLALAIGGQPDLHHVGHAATGAEARRLVAELRPDVVVMDVDLPDDDGVVVTEQLRAAFPDTRIVVLTAAAEPELVGRATAAGASGFLTKDGALGDVLHAVHTAHGGGMTVSSQLLTGLLRSTAPAVAAGAGANGARCGGLTAREHEVLRLMAAGMDARAIARRLGITLHTCRGYVKSVLAKLDAHSQLEAVAVATRRGLLSTDRG
ncbi:MAG TPA: response regulator transcription factor [Actinoplanes sp.]|nr:response regulator transcription factor [Actinoplanes sp.]